MKQETTLDSILKPIAGLMLLTPPVAVLLFALYAWSGFVLQCLWGWFIVPAFGLPPLSIPGAIGITLVAAMLAKQYVPSEKGEAQWKQWARMFMRPAFSLLIGWIVTKFI